MTCKFLASTGVSIRVANRHSHIQTRGSFRDISRVRLEARLSLSEREIQSTIHLVFALFLFGTKISISDCDCRGAYEPTESYMETESTNYTNDVHTAASGYPGLWRCLVQVCLFFYQRK